MILTRLVQVTLLFVIGWALSTPGRTEETGASPQMVANILDYIRLDYPVCVRDGTVVNAAEYREQQEFCAEALKAVRKLRPAPDELIRQVVILQTAIEAKVSGESVSAQADALRAKVLERYSSSTAPVSAPAMDQAPTLFDSRCAVCHGSLGKGDGPAGRSLVPAPSNFLNQQRMDRRSAYSIFSVITLGVKGTAMPAFGNLSAGDRWALAFYVSSLRFSPSEIEEGRQAWESGHERDFFSSLGRLTEAQPSAWDGSRKLVCAYLLRHPDKVPAPALAPLALARLKLKQASEAYDGGDGQRVLSLLISAYLEGYELGERQLAQLDGPLALEIEAKMLELREMARDTRRTGEFQKSIQEVDSLLKQAEGVLESGSSSPSAIFAASFLLLLREGLEAVLVVAGLMAVLRKAGRSDAIRYIHLGWMAACGLGIVTWFVAWSLFKSSGASREVAEGFTALFAAATLLYVGLWLHGKAQAGAWQRYLRESIQSALSGRTMWALASISFLAVYREVFELVLFYQAMWLTGETGSPAHTALLGGIVAGAVALVLAGWVLLRVSVRLPLGIFFALAGVSLSLLAIIFLGNAVAAFQEAGWLSATRLSILSPPLAGFRPTYEALLVQLPVTLGLTALLTWQQRKPVANVATSSGAAKTGGMK